MLRKLQEKLGYSEEEMKLFLDNPRNQDLLAQAPIIMGKNIVAKVVEAHGCASGHQVGDELLFDGAGNLLTKQAPSRVCVYAMEASAKLIYAAVELLYAGADPNRMRFNRTGCTDVGLECGGLGRIVLEVGTRDRQG